MDQAYLRAHPEHLPTFLTHQRIRETPVGDGSVSTASRLTLDDGTSLFAKTWAAGDPPTGFFEAEANGLRWLAEAGAATPELLVALPQMIALDWIDSAPATKTAAERLGHALAALHGTPAEAFGAPWPGYIGPLPMDNTSHPGPWPAWFAERRLWPYLKSSAANGALSPSDTAVVDQVLDKLADMTEDVAPSRTHGDLWPGNILWSTGDRAYLIDPAAHGGHPETDLANLHLFGGAAHLDRILSAYLEVRPLADGWHARIPLHQLHLLLVHTAAFGGAYQNAVVTAATKALRAF